MEFKVARLTVAALLASVLAGCAMRENPAVPGGAAGAGVPLSVVGDKVPNISGVYKGTCTETTQGKTVKDPLQMTIKQTGDKFTGIFDLKTGTVSDEFPIEKGVVSVKNGKTHLHFILEGAPGRNARAKATLVGDVIKGTAKVSAKHGPAVRFKYSAKKT